MEYPRVLVISHNPFSDTQNNGKTLSAFFNGWPKDKIAQLYLTLDKYDSTICEKFFRFSDLEVLKKFFNKNINIGKEFNKENKTNDDEKEKAHRNKLYVFIRNLFLKRIPLMYCIRNFMWNKVKPWKEENFIKWIKEYSPDVVFFQSSNLYSVFDIVEFICNQNDIPLIMETTDDYVTPKISIDPFFWINHFKLLKRYKKAVIKSKYVVAIGDVMAEEYSKRFGGNFIVAMNSIYIKEKIIPYSDVKNDKIIFTYAGNLGLNRWRVLKKIGEALKEIEEKENICSIMNIYSLNKPSKSILNKLNIPNIMEFKGSLNSEELVREKNKSDILLHVESFDRKNRYITRLSISTKIPEYLLSKRCILAIGPKNVASIKYIKENNIGKVLTQIKKSNLKKDLLEIIKNRQERNMFIDNGIKIVEKNHSFEKNKEKVQNAIINTKEKKC